jgi:uncharacterized protein with FMN-binding domain
MKRKRLLVRILIVIAIAIAAGITIFAVVIVPKLEEGLKVLDTLEFGELKLSSVTDGRYEGSYSAGIVKATVSVAIRDHRIEDIEILKHDNGKGKAAESITKDVIARQSVQVDVVSGATYSSKVILKAIENALAK